MQCKTKDRADSENLVKQVYVHVPRMPSSRRGLSEKIVRRRLEKQGYTIWRGGFLYAAQTIDPYPNVLKKYQLLEKLLDKHKPMTKEPLQYMCRVNHGMPDLLVFKRGKFKFVECKLIYEQLSRRQKICIRKVIALGFIVEIHRVVDDRTKAREAIINLNNGDKKILVEQKVLRR